MAKQTLTNTAVPRPKTRGNVDKSFSDEVGPLKRSKMNPKDHVRQGPNTNVPGYMGQKRGYTK